MGINDLLEDYRITGGFKLSGDLNSNEYLISFENLKHRLDKQITFYRQARFLTSLYEAVKVHTHELRYTNKWPFSDVAAVSGSIAYRNDRFVTLSTEAATLRKPTQYDDWATALFQFVFDNTLSTGPQPVQRNATEGIRRILQTAGQESVRNVCRGIRYQALPEDPPQPDMGQPVCRQRIFRP
jgi:hypothetical protein